MAYNRQIELVIGENNGLGLKISDLNVSFDIKRSYKLESNTANFTIYNAKKETRDKIIQKDNQIILKAGYEDEGMGTIFSGLIFQGSSKKVGTDWITEIIANDYGRNSTNIFRQTINLAYKEGIPINMVINDISSILDLTVNGTQNSSNIYVNNAKVFSGLAKDVIQNIANILKVNNIGLYFDSNEMVIYNLGQKSSTFGIVNINQNSGLIGSIEDITDNSQIEDEKKEAKKDRKKRYAFTSLMNSKIKPNCLINLKAENVQGLFIVEQANFKGDNFGGEFNVRLEVVE